jgi:holo-[acyl-carrier protein] synthase
MRILGHGLDLVDVARFKPKDCSGIDQEWERLFLPRELDAVGHGPNRASRLAARFAAKEAVLKALGTGWGDGIAFTNVELTATSLGAPGVTLHGGAAARAAELGITRWIVSLTHTTSIAAASAIALGE